MIRRIKNCNLINKWHVYSLKILYNAFFINLLVFTNLIDKQNKKAEYWLFRLFLFFILLNEIYD